jgi:hypothetical protein
MHGNCAANRDDDLGSIKRREGLGHNSWPKIRSGKCWEFLPDPAGPSWLKGGPGQPWQDAPHRSGQSGMPGRECCNRCSRIVRHRVPPAYPDERWVIHHANAAWRHRADGPAGIPEGRKRKTGEMDQASYFSQHHIIPQILSKWCMFIQPALLHHNPFLRQIPSSAPVLVCPIGLVPRFGRG